MRSARRFALRFLPVLSAILLVTMAFMLHSSNVVVAADPAPNPVTCGGYPGPKRTLLETQSWWMATSSIGSSMQVPPVSGNGGHTHTATCFPQDQMIPDGPMTFHVRLMLHKGNIGKVSRLDIGGGPSGVSYASKDLNNLQCTTSASDVSKNCEWWIPITLNVDSRIPAGYQELRFRFFVNFPNGERQFASTGWNAYFHGATSPQFRTPSFMEARGWYTDVEYQNARLTSGLPSGPVSGNWTIKFDAKPGAGGTPTTHSAVHVNARFNAEDFGWTVKEVNGPMSGSLTIDTTKLTNGEHCLAIKTDSSVVFDAGTNTGILQFPFVVNNPGKAAGNGKGGCSAGTGAVYTGEGGTTTPPPPPAPTPPPPTSPPPTTPPPSGNLLSAAQSSLETAPLLWNPLEKANLSQGSVARSGAFSLRFSSTSATGRSRFASSGRLFAVTPGTRYTAAAYLRAAATANSWRFGLRWYDADGDLLSQVHAADKADTTSGWTAYSYSAVAPTGATHGAVSLQLTTIKTTAEVHYIDDASAVAG